MRDLVQRHINCRMPAVGICTDLSFGGQSAFVFCQGQLPDFNGKRIKSQAQVQRPCRKQHGFLKQSFGIHHHLAELKLSDKGCGQFHTQGADDRGAIGAGQIAVSRGRDAQGRALHAKIRQIDAPKAGIIPQRHGGCVKQDGAGLGIGLQSATGKGQLCLHPRNSACVQRGGNAARDRRVDDACPCQRRDLRCNIFGRNTVNLRSQARGIRPFLGHNRNHGMRCR